MHEGRKVDTVLCVSLVFYTVEYEVDWGTLLDDKKEVKAMATPASSAASTPASSSSSASATSSERKEATKDGREVIDEKTKPKPPQVSVSRFVVPAQDCR
jgi:hypothetical protein